MRKNAKIITTLGKNENNLEIQKSRPLSVLWQSNLTLSEFKILDMYLGRINSHDEEHRVVVLEKGEIEKALGVTQIKKADLKDRLKHLMQNVVEIPDIEEDDGIGYVTLFEEVKARKDSYGQWRVILECTQKAKKYFFNIDNLGYYRYKLRCITTMKSRYTYIMFNYLESNRWRKTWECDLDEIKVILGCEKEETYKTYKRFNDLILKKAYKDITENTECKYSYESIKKGKFVVAIKFELQTLKDIEVVEPKEIEYEQLSLSPIESQSEIDYGGELANLLGSSSCHDEFSVEQVRVIQDLVLKAVKSSDRLEMSDYLSEKIHKMNLYDSKTKIKDRFAYLCKMIEKEIK